MSFPFPSTIALLFVTFIFLEVLVGLFASENTRTHALCPMDYVRNTKNN